MCQKLIQAQILKNNHTRTARPGGLQEVNIIEPKIGDKGKLIAQYVTEFLVPGKTILATSYPSIKPAILIVRERFLATVPYNVGFHFFISEGQYTGETAVSLVTFAKDVEVVPIESIDFHFKRSDFQKWIADTIGDKKLATEIGQVQKELAGEQLRQKLLRIINARVKELKIKSFSKQMKWKEKFN